MHIIVEGRSRVLVAGEAEGGRFVVRRQEFAAEPAFGLQAAQFGDGAMEEAMSFAAAAIDGLPSFVEQGVKVAIADEHYSSFDGGTAAQAPG